jgi:excisionase family DNA binding protein
MEAKVLTESEFMTKKEVAQLLKVSIDTVNRMVRHGKISHIKIMGKVLFTREELLKDVESFRKK